MSHIPKVTLLGMYQYDDTIFDYLDLPSNISKETFIDTLFTLYGENPTIYPNGDYIKWYIGLWSRKRYDDLQKIAAALLDDYNPLHNFDRHEEYTDVEQTENSLDTSGSTENKVSAYNSSTYQPDDQQLSSGTSSGSEDRNLTHTGHLYGNIGVTTSQQMLEAELELRQKSNLYDIATRLLASEICILIY